ncbi:MAG TPA: hypothetical protein VFH80_01250 [Solirubrobacteraceae bacterium]|nr:hypothetical protein [Solirubrobacteraceae bacterium]
MAGWLRAARAYLPGFGTAGSLLAGAVLMFIVASALVAFRGWPHVGAQPSPGEVVVSPAPATSGGSPSARRLALFVAGPAIGAAAPAAAGARRLPGAGPGPTATPHGSLGRPATASRPAPAPAAGGTAGSCAGGCTSVTAQPGSAISVPTPTQPTQPVQQVVKQTTSALGGVLSGTGNQVGSAVQQTTGAVGGAVQPVSPPAAGVVDSAGSGAAKTVTGVTQTIAGALSGLPHH